MSTERESDAPKKEKAPSAADLQADLEIRRARLADTVDGLTAQLDPRQNIAEIKDQLADTAANASEEAQEFISRVKTGDDDARTAVGLVVAAVGALVGAILIRRGR